MNASEPKPLILIVEDDAAQRLMLSETLDIAGFDYVETVNGEEALNSVTERLPDAILLDVMMPVMDGFETCQAIRARAAWKDIPIIMMTGMDDVQAIHRAYECGATDFLTKPIQYELLEYRVRYMLRSASLTRDLRASEHRMSNTQRIAQLGHWEWEPSNNRIKWSSEAIQILHIAPETSLEEFLAGVPSAETHSVEEWYNAARDGSVDTSIRHHFLCEDQEIYLRQHAEPILDERGALMYIYGSLIDITDIRRANEKIHQLAYFDGLTGLPNREQFRDKLELSVSHAQRKSRRMATMFMDLDHFKRINDSLGHAVGDLLLRQVAERIAQSLRANDSVERLGLDNDDQMAQVARLGGDEFTILLAEIEEPEDAAIVARRILETFTKPFDLDGNEVFVTSSIGIAVYPEDGADMDTLLKQADVAMYSAKREGRNGYRFFRQEMNQVIERRMKVENELRRAVDKKELDINYQLQQDLASNQYCGVEALVRWNNEALGGQVSPVEFIEVAEECDLIGDIGAWVLKKACEDLLRLREKGIGLQQISVNISVAQFEKVDFVDEVKRTLKQTGLDASSLELEITESLMMSNYSMILESIAELQRLGIKFAIDDFGTGYSSLTYLKRLNLDRLKIDRSFIHDLAESPENTAITKAVIALAGGLGLTVIAEGVESIEQSKLLEQWGCDEIQGYLISKPLTLEMLQMKLSSQSS